MTGRERGVGIRERLVVLVTVTLALALAGAGLATYVVQHGAALARIDAELQQEVEEVQARAHGRDPAGRPYDSVEDLMADFMRYNVMGPDESMAVFVAPATRPRFVAGGERSVDLQDPALYGAVLTAAAPGRSTLTTVQVDGRDVRAIVADVAGAATTGSVVVAIDRGARLDDLSAVMRVYAVAAFLTLLLTATLLHLAVGRLLAPLGELLTATTEIDSRELTRRVPVPSQSTEVAMLARRFNAMLDRLEDAFTAQRRFLDDTAHELRTPLTIMRGNLEVIDPGDPEDVRATVDIEMGEIDRMRRIVDDLLTLARLQRPEEVRLAPVDVDVLHADLMALVPALGDRAWIDGGCTPGRALLDRDRVVQAVQQLCANAMAFSAPGSPITLRTGIAGPVMMISVADAGVGIAPDRLDTIFDRFDRGSAAPDGRGVGLGLPIVWAIASAHDGTVTVDSPGVGLGTTFTLTLPTRSEGS